MRKLFKQTTLMCFSPPVMIATFFIEMGLVMWILLVRPKTSAVRVTTLLITALAVFQLAEYGICESMGFGSDAWAKIGFTSITLLPPLGLHLTHLIAGRKNNRLIAAGYAAAAAWIATFVMGDIMQGSVCSGNYVIFHITEPQKLYYYIYYEVILLYTVLLAYIFASKHKTRRIQQALRTLAFGYLSFIVPSMILRMFFHSSIETSSSLPSIMCGFAVILATLLAVSVLPKTESKLKKK